MTLLSISSYLAYYGFIKWYRNIQATLLLLCTWLLIWLDEFKFPNCHLLIHQQLNLMIVRMDCTYWHLKKCRTIYDNLIIRLYFFISYWFTIIVLSLRYFILIVYYPLTPILWSLKFYPNSGRIFLKNLIY